MATPQNEYSDFSQMSDRNSFVGFLMRPLLLIIIGLILYSGGSIFAVLLPTEVLPRGTAIYYSVGGLVLSFILWRLLVSIYRLDSSWREFGLGRNTVLVLLSLGWLIGAVGGFYYCYILAGQI